MRDEDREREAREVLERARRDSETLGGSSVARAARRLGDHFAGRDAEPQDPVELWGRRIGRGLSLIGVVALALWLAVQLGWLRLP